MKTALVLVNYNGIKDTLDCIASVKKAKDAPDIIVVDNASKDGSVEKLKKVKGIELIASDTNLGFTGGNNLGMERALKKGAQFVYLLNNDTTVDKNLFLEAQKQLKSDTIIGAKIYYEKGYEYHKSQKGKGNILWYAGGYMDWDAVVGRHRGVDEVDSGQYDKTEATGFISGCFMAIPKKVIERVGYFDNRFFLYLEDMDYSLRAKDIGIKLIYHPKCILYHRNAATTGAGSALTDYYFTRNRLLLGFKHGSRRIKLALLKEAFTRNIRPRVRWLAVRDFLAGKWGNRNAQIKKIQK